MASSDEPAEAGGEETTKTVAVDSTAAAAATDCTRTTTARAVVPANLVELVESSAKTACVELDIVEADGRAGVRASEEADVDLWISDSTMWAQARREPLPGKATSIASSPVVAVAEPGTAAKISQDGIFSWQSVAALPKGSTMAFQDPTNTATGLLTAWPILSTLRQYDSVKFHGLALSANALAGSAVLTQGDLMAPPAGTLGFAGEYAVKASDSAQVLRGKEGEPYFDFPAYNQARDAETKAGVQTLIEALASSEASAERIKARLRNAAGVAEFDLAALGTAGPRLPLPGPRDALSIFGLSASGSAVGRNLVVMDVSGSMAALQPNGKTLFDTVRETSLLAMTTLLDHTSVGLWAFGSEINGRLDYRPVEPIAPLAKNRQRLVGALQAMQPVPGSGTGLYDTILAGYRTLQKDFDPTAVTTLIVMTDGKNDEASGLNLAQLKKELRRIQDPKKPIALAGIGFGGADIASLTEISEITGGRVAKVKDPVQLLGIMISMIGETAARA